MTTDNTDTGVTRRDVKTQFGPAEEAHVTGAASAKEPDLRWLVEEIGATGIEEVSEVVGWCASYIDGMPSIASTVCNVDDNI